MNAIQNIAMDLARPGPTPCVYAVQGDSDSRVLKLELKCDGHPWPIPEGVGVAIRYRKPDSTGGTYDTLPDGRKAWTAERNMLTVILAPQVCTAAGKTTMELTLMQEQEQLTTFRLAVCVSGKLAEGEDSEDYTNLAAWLQEQGRGPQGIPGIQGQPGRPGEDGGCYVPSVSQTDASTMKVSFRPSKAEMAAVPGVSIRLPAGRDGANGTPGSDGHTPVRGTDYWTAADIAAIKSYVEDAILGGAW